VFAGVLKKSRVFNCFGFPLRIFLHTSHINKYLLLQLRKTNSFVELLSAKHFSPLLPFLIFNSRGSISFPVEHQAAFPLEHFTAIPLVQAKSVYRLQRGMCDENFRRMIKFFNVSYRKIVVTLENKTTIQDAFQKKMYHFHGLCGRAKVFLAI
jgi:hypothetical protein